jgi:hypothetical protein
LAPINNSNGDGFYLVDWIDVVGATSYELQEDDSSDFKSAVTVYTGSSTQFAVGDRSVGTWHYRVRAHNGAGYGPWSESEWVEVLFELRTYLPLVQRDAEGGP